MNFLHKIKFALRRLVFYVYARIKYFYPVWLFLNSEGRNLFKKYPPQLNKEQIRTLDQLKKDGIAVTSLENLFPGENILATLQEYERSNRREKKQIHKKTFFVDYLDAIPKLELRDPLVKLMLSPRILDVVNSYMGMFSRITFYTLQMTEVTKGKKTFSQNWHRDPQEQKFCKVFILLNDVDKNTGPFVYIPQSAYGHKYSNLFPQKAPHGSYPDEDELEKYIPKNEWRVMTGKAGTVIFCDTIGFHRGGYAKEKPRIMSTFSYGAKTYRENKSYKVSKSFLQEIKNLPLQSNFAINKKWTE